MKIEFLIWLQNTMQYSTSTNTFLSRRISCDSTNGHRRFCISNRYLIFEQSIKRHQNYSLYSFSTENISENLEVNYMLWSDFPFVESEIMQFLWKSIELITVMKSSRVICFNDMICLYNLLLSSYRAEYLQDSIGQHTDYFVLIQETKMN